MSLQSKYLAISDISKTESITIYAPAEVIFPIIQELDFSNSVIIRCLFRLRGMPVPDSLSLRGLERLNFVRLETIKNSEMIIGLIGQFWQPSGLLQKFQPEEFIAFNDPAFAKATWSFTLMRTDENKTVLFTETRVLCPSSKSKKKFLIYWKVIQPFSSWIRREILKSIKAKAERIGQRKMKQ